MKAGDNMKKKYGKLLCTTVALLLCTAMLLGGCGQNTSDGELNSMQQANKLGMTYGDDDSVTNRGENAPVIELTPGTKPYRSKGKWETVAGQKLVFDLKVTTFNVGQWYHGVCNLDIYGAQENVHEGIKPEYVIGAYNSWMTAFPEYDADVICAQEVNPTFLIDSKKDITLMTKDVLEEQFKEVHTFEGATQNGQMPMWNGMFVTNESDYTLKNITTGHLCEGMPAYSRAYMKGYITVNGHDIAIYCVHLQPGSSDLGNPEIRRQAYAELIEMASKDEYAIIMGDMNCESADEFQIMKDAGFNMANCGEFGAFDTYEYGAVEPIDNIFTTNNIDIAYVECEQILVGGSDHYPLSAYLVIQDQPHTSGNPYSVGADDYLEGWYLP